MAAKTDKIDARILASLSFRDLVPAVWIPGETVRANRERARFRIFLVNKRTALKNRIHSSMIEFGRPCPVSDLFGKTGRQLLGQLDLSEPWGDHIRVCLELIGHYDQLISDMERELRSEVLVHPNMDLLVTVRAATLELTGTPLDRFWDDKPDHCAVTTLRPGTSWKVQVTWSPQA